MSFLSTAFNWLTGNSVAANLTKIALLGYTSKLLSNTTDPEYSATQETPDPGVRLQLNPDTEYKIPVLYGDAYFGGMITDAQLSSDYKTMTYCVTLAEQTDTGSYTFHDVYLNNNRVVFQSDGVTVDYTVDKSGNQDISARDLVKIYLYADGPKQPDGYSGTTPASDTVMPGWTAVTHPMTGLIYAIIEVQYTRGGSTGVPNTTFHIENSLSAPGSVLLDYMQNSVYGAGIATSDIDTSFAELDTYCATGFSYTDLESNPQTQAIKINGLVDTKLTVLDNMKKLAEGSNSWLNYNIHTGKWGVIINQSGTSVASFDDSNILGEISVGGTSLTQLSNIADVRYQNTDLLDTADFVKISIPAGDLYDNEVPRTMQMSLPFTNNQVTATHIGLQALKQARADKVITFTADFSYVNLTAGSIVDVTSSVYGYTNKLFRVITAQEVEDETGAISIAFTALEYDADVYVYDIAQYEVETDDGILTIGAIGTPDIPVVTKTEQANVPKIVISADVPSGIVEALEFWITFDVDVPNDYDRTYINIGSYSNPNGSLLTENQTIDYTYSQLGASDFYVKVRGVNRVVNGPYSEPTGLIEYVPVVVADTLSDTPVDFGGQLMSLGLLTLLNNLDELLAVFNGEKGIKDALKDIFFGGGDSDPDDAATLLNENPEFTSALADNTEFTDSLGDNLANNPNFVNSINSQIPDLSINDLTDVDTVTATPNSGDVLYWNGSKWVPGEVDADITPTPPEQQYLFYYNYCAADATTWATESGATTAPHRAALTGSYLVSIGGPLGIYSAPTVNTGNFYLYKSDGTLVETVAIGDCILHEKRIEIPFAAREAGTNYYILADENMLSYGDAISEAIDDPTVWNFNTPKFVTPPECPIATVAYDTVEYPDLAVTAYTPQCGTSNNFTLTYNYTVTAGSGVATIKQGGTTVHTFDIGDATITDNFVEFGAIPGLQYDTTYTVEVDAGFVLAEFDVDTPAGTVVAISQSSDATSYAFGTGPQLAFSSLTATLANGSDVDPESHITLVFNTSISIGSAASPEISIYKSGGALHQTFVLANTFEGQKVSSELFSIETDSIRLNPTVDFDLGSDYYINIAPDTLSACGDSYAGVSDSSTITFTTYSGPQVESTTPDSGYTGSFNDLDPIEMTFDSPIYAGTGVIEIKDSLGTVIATLDANDPAVTLS